MKQIRLPSSMYRRFKWASHIKVSPAPPWFGRNSGKWVKETSLPLEYSLQSPNWVFTALTRKNLEKQNVPWRSSFDSATSTLNLYRFLFQIEELFKLFDFYDLFELYRKWRNFPTGIKPANFVSVDWAMQVLTAWIKLNFSFVSLETKAFLKNAPRLYVTCAYSPPVYVCTFTPITPSVFTKMGWKIIHE